MGCAFTNLLVRWLAVTVRIDDLLHARAFIAAVMGGWYLCNRMNDSYAFDLPA